MPVTAASCTGTESSSLSTSAMCLRTQWKHTSSMYVWWEKVCPGCISETVRCRKLILGRHCLRGVGVQCHGVTLI